jgi:hypothetical protein
MSFPLLELGMVNLKKAKKAFYNALTVNLFADELKKIS